MGNHSLWLGGPEDCTGGVIHGGAPSGRRPTGRLLVVLQHVVVPGVEEVVPLGSDTISLELVTSDAGIVCTCELQVLIRLSRMGRSRVQGQPPDDLGSL